MHVQFPDWYRTAGVEPPGELLHSRWKAVEAVASAVNAELFQILLGLAAGVSVSDDNRVTLLTTFQNTDPTIPASGASHELRILAAAVLRQIIEEGDSFATVSALGLSCAVFSRPKVPAAEHVSAANEFLAIESSEVRKPRPALKGRAQFTKAAYDKILSETVLQNPAQTNEALFKLTGALVDALNLANVDLKQTVSLQQEELNLLWWRITTHSRALDVPFSSLQLQPASVILPAELADLTVFAPGPAAISGLIESALSQCKNNGEPLSIKSVINSLPREWRDKRASKLPAGLASACPVHAAISASMKTNGESEWLPIFEQTYGADSSAEHAGLNFAMQGYQERMLWLALEQVK